jgi:hypothetical protein
MKPSHDVAHQFTARKFATIVGLAGIAAIHLMDLPGKFTETPYLGVAYVGMIAAAFVLIERIVKNAKPIDFLAAAGLAASVFAGFVVNRTVGMPGAMGDIGNWFEPLGFLSLFVEAFTAWQALSAFNLSKGASDEALRKEFADLSANQDYVLNLS